MKSIVALTGGLAGALAVTALHELIKNTDPKDAPRMDLLGIETLSKIANEVGLGAEFHKNAYPITLAGDIIGNTIYYSAVGMGNKSTWLKGSIMGLAAGVGAIYLPKPMGLNPKHSNRTQKTKVLSLLYYLTGGLVAAGVVRLLNKKEKPLVKAL